MAQGEPPPSTHNLLKKIFSRSALTPKNILCGVSFTISAATALLGFFSAALSIYIGDLGVRLLFIALSLLFTSLLTYSMAIQKKGRHAIGLLAFTIILILCAYAVPFIPPAYGLQQFQFTASILKFLAISMLLTITGIIGASLALKPLYNFSRRANELSAYFLLTFAVLLIIYPLIVIIGNIIVNGAGGITWDFLTQDVIKHGELGGVNHAIIGTLIIIAGTALIALPLGIASAIYLIEYAKTGLVVRIIRIAADILQGIPSIVFGLFGLAVFVPLFGISILSGILIMSFMTLPIIIRSSEEALLCIPHSIREGSYTLGATKWQTIRRTVLPPPSRGSSPEASSDSAEPQERPPPSSSQPPSFEPPSPHHYSAPRNPSRITSSSFLNISEHIRLNKTPGPQPCSSSESCWG